MKSALRLLLALTLSALDAPAQTLPKTVQKSADGTNAITESLTFGSGKTLALNGTVTGTPTGGTLNLTGLTLTLGTPASATLTNATGLPISTGISGLGAGVATFLATPSSANLATAVTGETGSGALVFGTGPTLSAPIFSSIVNTGTLTLPAATDTLVGRATTDTLTNKSISGATNTLTAIPNSALGNSTVTLGSTSLALGSTTTSIAGLGTLTGSGDLSLAGATAGTNAVKITNTTASTSTTTGALQVAGGMGVAGAGYFVGTLNSTGINVTTGSNQLGVLSSSSAAGPTLQLSSTNAAGTTAAIQVINFISTLSLDAVSVTTTGSFAVGGTGSNFSLPKTITAAGTTGAQTINRVSGTVNFAAAATSLVVTNSLVSTTSVITATVGTNDTTMKSVAVVAASGSFTIYPNAAPTAETRVNFRVSN